MIHDAKVEVTCDGDGCYESITVNPPYMHRDYSGNNGFYDCSDDVIEGLVAGDGWTVEDGKHFCESCREQPDEDDDSPQQGEATANPDCAITTPNQTKGAE